MMQVNFRTEKRLIEMLDALAEAEYRTRTKQIEYLIQREYEAKFGKGVEEKDNENPKPSI